MSRDYDPQPGQWYEDLERRAFFHVISVDPDEEIVRLQWLEGDVVDIYLDNWSELDLELADEPEGWVADDAVKDGDPDDDWNEEEPDDEDEEEEDWDDDYDEYHDRQ